MNLPAFAHERKPGTGLNKLIGLLGLGILYLIILASCVAILHFREYLLNLPPDPNAPKIEGKDKKSETNKKTERR